MNPFKAQLLQDMDAVFLNLEEWGEVYTINGKQVRALIDNEKLADLKAKGQFSEGIHRAETLIFVKTQDLGGKPAKGAAFSIGSNKYRVFSADGDEFLEIILEANRRNG